MHRVWCDSFHCPWVEGSQPRGLSFVVMAASACFVRYFLWRQLNYLVLTFFTEDQEP